MADLPELLTVATVAKHLGLSTKTVRRRIRDGAIAAHRLGNNVRVDAASVMRLLVPINDNGTDRAVPMQENNSELPQLHRQRGRNRNWTTIIDGIEISLDTYDAEEANKRLAVLAARRGPSGARSGRKRSGLWRVTQEGRRGFVIKYYDKANKRRNHRIPADLEPPIVTLDAAEKYAEQWYELQVAQQQIEEIRAIDAVVGPTFTSDAPVATLSEAIEQPAPQASGQDDIELKEITSATTFREIAEMWTKGVLAKRFPAYIKKKRSSYADDRRLSKYAFPVIGNIPIGKFTGSDGTVLASRVSVQMSKLNPNLRTASIRHILQAVATVLKMSVYPLGVLPSYPLPEGFIPPPGEKKAKAYLYPSEERALLACPKIPVEWRLAIGILTREGLRISELLGLEWSDVDLDAGLLSLDENKTDEPRSWALNPSVVQALRRWKKMLKREALATNKITVHPMSGRTLTPEHAAVRLRKYARLAGISRSQLYEKSEKRIPLRAHDLRGTFVTVSLAQGRTESWVADRTGHGSSDMIQTYKRPARSFEEVNLGPLAPLHESIPELAGMTET